jgi:hypothetical protein
VKGRAAAPRTWRTVTDALLRSTTLMTRSVCAGATFASGVRVEPIDRSIDPYRTLGVRKDCSREELKDAFRAKAQVLHPDRGGAPAAFIELREAFDQVCRELDKRPTTPIVQPRKRPAGSDRARGQPDPDWDPDLIVRDEPLPRIRPARRRDPDWQPEVILLDEPNPSGRPQTRDAGSSSQEYVGWLRRLAARSQRPLALDLLGRLAQQRRTQACRGHPQA